MNTIHGITNKNIGVFVEPQFLPHSAGKREETIEILKGLQFQDETRKIITIDGTAASSNIEIITDQNFVNQPILLPKGIDGVILNSSEKARLILPVADCAPINAYHKSGEICGSFHAGYKGVAGEDASDLGIITNMIEGLKEVSNSQDLKDFEFYIGPMIGRNFELPKSYVEPMFSRIFKEYNLKPEKYFLKHKTDNTKIYLHLRLLIRDILEKLGKKIKLQGMELGSFFDNSKTDNWNSDYPSHRLYTKFNNFDKENEEIRKMNKNIKSKKFDLYRKDYRLATILDN